MLFLTDLRVGAAWALFNKKVCCIVLGISSSLKAFMPSCLSLSKAGKVFWITWWCCLVLRSRAMPFFVIVSWWQPDWASLHWVESRLTNIKAVNACHQVSVSVVGRGLLEDGLDLLGLFRASLLFQDGCSREETKRILPPPHHRLPCEALSWCWGESRLAWQQLQFSRRINFFATLVFYHAVQSLEKLRTVP